LHVCYISQEYPPDTGWGGVGAYTYEMAHALADAGKQVTVISRAVNGESVTVESGIEIHRVSPRAVWDKLPLLWRLNRIWPDFSWAAMQRLRQIHRHKPIDVVEAAEVRADAFFTSLLPRRPKLITRLHTAQIFVDQFNAIPGERLRPWNYWFEKQSINRANLVTAPSRAIVNLTQTWLPMRNREIVVVPNPISKTQFKPAGVLRKQLVLFVGRLERNKGAETILAAIPEVLKRFPAVEFRFIGADSNDIDGKSWRHKIEAQLGCTEKARVSFVEMSREELKHAYQEAAVCILPSAWENLPYALLESMACGTPVIACETGGAAELIENEVSGFLIPTNDSAMLAKRISELFANDSLRSSLGQNARRRIEEYFSTDRVVPKMMAVYDQAMAQA